MGKISDEFYKGLDNEVAKVESCFKRRIKQGVKDLSDVLENQEQWLYTHNHYLLLIIDNLINVGFELHDICCYVELNITGIRKILKKCDKKFNGIVKHRGLEYIKSRLRNPKSHMNGIL